jgi:hypothetical protein
MANKQNAHDLEISQLKLDGANLRAELKDLERELKETDHDQQAALDLVKGFVNSMALALGDADDVKKMKESARNGGIAFGILKWGGTSMGAAVIIAFVAWVISGGLSPKKADVGTSRVNPAMIGPPAPK